MQRAACEHPHNNACTMRHAPCDMHHATCTMHHARCKMYLSPVSHRFAKCGQQDVDHAAFVQTIREVGQPAAPIACATCNVRPQCNSLPTCAVHQVVPFLSPEQADALFGIFDDDGNGSVTIGALPAAQTRARARAQSVCAVIRFMRRSVRCLRFPQRLGCVFLA